MRSENMSFMEALNQVKKLRAIVSPNHGFVEQLKIFEAMKCQFDPEHELYKEWRRKARAIGKEIVLNHI